MTDTTIYKNKVEPYVRRWLSERYKTEFQEKEVVLSNAQSPQSTHRFDAVSSDNKIVAGVNSSSGKTTGGKNPSGKITKAYQELYFLSLIEAERRLLVVTDPEFFDLLSKQTKGRLARGVEILLCPLSQELQEELNPVRSKAAREVGG